MKGVIAVDAIAGNPMGAGGALKLVATVALATVIASPAFAKSVRHHSHGTAVSAYAKSAAAGVGRSSNAVYWQGHYVGADPDPNVRANLLRDNRYTRGGF